MKKYDKPIIIEETIDLEDICAVSGGTSGGDANRDGLTVTPDNIW